MAKTFISCAGCGGNIRIEARNGKEAARCAVWFEKQGLTCDACKARAYAEESAIKAAVNAAAALPTLAGSEKQVAWAETIRADRLAYFDRAIALAKSPGEVPADAPDKFIIIQEDKDIRDVLKFEDGPAIISAFQAILRRQDAARWWIDTRMMSIKDYLICG